jgi:hypothetical protein
MNKRKRKKFKKKLGAKRTYYGSLGSISLVGGILTPEMIRRAKCT